MTGDVDGGWDEQDQSEVFDEDNQNLDGAGELAPEMRVFEELPEVLDLTSAEGDADDDAALIGEDLDDDEIIQLETDALDEDDGERADLEDDGDVGGRDEVELVYQADLERAEERDLSTSAAMESDTVSDEDLAALGYTDGAAP